MKKVTLIKDSGVFTIERVVHSNNKKYLALGGYHGRITLVNFHTSKYVKFHLHGDFRITGMSFSSDSNYLCVTYNSNEKSLIKIFNIEEQRVIYQKEFNRHWDYNSDRTITASSNLYINNEEHFLCTFWNTQSYCFSLKKLIEKNRIEEYPFINIKSATQTLQYKEKENVLIFRKSNIYEILFVNTMKFAPIKMKHCRGVIKYADAIKIINDELFLFSPYLGINVFKLDFVNSKLIFDRNYPILSNVYFKDLNEVRQRVNSVAINPNTNTCFMAIRKGWTAKSKVEFLEWDYVNNKLIQDNLTDLFKKVQYMTKFYYNLDYSRLVLIDKDKCILYQNDLLKKENI